MIVPTSPDDPMLSWPHLCIDRWRKHRGACCSSTCVSGVSWQIYDITHRSTLLASRMCRMCTRFAESPWSFSCRFLVRVVLWGLVAPWCGSARHCFRAMHLCAQVAQLALKHRQNKNQKQRIVAFIGSPISAPEKELEATGSSSKREMVACSLRSIAHVRGLVPSVLLARVLSVALLFGCLHCLNRFHACSRVLL